MLAAAWRFLDRYLEVFQTQDSTAVKLAVLFGVAAKLTQNMDLNDDRTDEPFVLRVWHVLAHKDLEPQIRTLELTVVNAFGKAGL